MLSGPPGIGKSSSARIVAKELGYNVLEFNASDNRSKKTIESLLKDMCTSSSIVRYGENNTAFKNRSVIIMDEVDGVSANDRGGLGALILIIKKTRVPMICIANDRHNRKLQSLMNHCYDLKFQK
jgi:replication factor C subunit 1